MPAAPSTPVDLLARQANIAREALAEIAAAEELYALDEEAIAVDDAAVLLEAELDEANTLSVTGQQKVHSVLWQSLDTGEIILDTGCRRSVAGRGFHRRYERYLNQLGLKGIRRVSQERFRYGNGMTEASTSSVCYPGVLGGRAGKVDIAEVPSEDVPPLLSRQAMCDLGMTLNFAANTLSLQDGAPMAMASRDGHPILDMRFAGGVVPDSVPDEFRIKQDDRVDEGDYGDTGGYQGREMR